MWDWFSSPIVQALLGVAVLLAAVYVGWQAIIALRPSTCKVDTNVDRLAQNFEEMQLEGALSDEELRTIKSVLGRTQDKQKQNSAQQGAGSS